MLHRRENALTSRFDGLLRRFADRRVLVLGDMVADEYVVGRPARISREAPVLILHHADSFVRPGGATNTAYNICSLGARVEVVGVVGDDDMGCRLKQALESLGIPAGGLIVDTGRPTSTKTRIIAKGIQEVQQQIVRIDRVETSPIEGVLRDAMIDALCAALPRIDALVISDYENGVISQQVIDACVPEARQRGLTVTVDSHGDLFRFKGVTAATPNQPEAEATLKTVIRTDAELEQAGRRLVEGMDAEGVLITRGSEGVALFERGKRPYTLPIALSPNGEVVDPAGAGDTVAAVFTLALSSGTTMPVAAYLANVAGGEVVRKLGTATITRDELSSALARTQLRPPTDSFGGE